MPQVGIPISRRTVGLGAGIGTLLVVWGLAGTGGAAPTPVSTCTTFDAPGTYELAGDVSAADVNDTTIEPWLHDGSWSQAAGTAGTNTASLYVYAEVTSSDVIVAPLGEAGSGANVSVPGFSPLVPVIALVVAAGVAWRRRL